MVSVIFSVLLAVSTSAIEFEGPFFEPAVIPAIFDGPDTPENVNAALDLVIFPIDPGSRLYRSDLGEFDGFSSLIEGSVGYLGFDGENLPPLTFLTLQIGSSSESAFVIFFGLLEYDGTRTLRVENTFLFDANNEPLPIDHFTIWGEGTDIGSPPASTVPETGTTFALLGAGLASLLLSRHRLQVK